ncbi:hypothetical protein [Flexivirga alba]|uniref:Uncharacterized protein n=1 Tax=Flexivirga alba TaxID=702742 RepID=A0ABW2AKH5_9MICO
MNDVKRDPAVDAVAGADGFERVRSETVRDHEELYASRCRRAGGHLARRYPAADG